MLVPKPSPGGEGGRTSGRRRAAIAFADVAGYSILTAADESGTHERWMALFRRVVKPEAAKVDGRIVSLHGDGVLAEFDGADAALGWARALHAASLAAHQADPDHPPIAFRIAIHVGSVLADEEIIFGDAVNLTARLQEFGTPGGIVLSADALASLRSDPGEPVRDLGELPLRNLPRPVHAFSMEPRGRAVPVPQPPPPARLPSLAVLPLTNLSDSSDDDYLAEGIVGDIIASIAGLQEVFVIAPDSTLMFRGQRPDPLRVGHILGVRFVVTGSMHRSGDGLRVSLQLSDTSTGDTLWSDQVETAKQGIFDLQERVVTEVIAGIAPNVRAASLRDAMRKRPENLNPYDLTLRGIHALAAPDRERFARGYEYLMLAIAEDPGFALPLAWAARWHSLKIGLGWSSDVRADGEHAIAYALRTIALDQRNSLALATLGHVRAYLQHDCDAALECFDRALAASPNDSWAWMLSSCTLSYVGRGEEAVRHAERGLRLSPYDPLRFSQHHFLGIANYAKGNLADAERWCRLSVGGNPLHAANWRILATILSGLGRFAEAAEAGRRMMSLEPGFRLGEYLRDRMPMRDPALRERVLRDISRVGFPP